MTISIPPGVFDIIPKDSNEEWRHSHLWDYVEKIMRDTASHYGFQEIRTPIFERTELFVRGIGETTDVVSKEMYTFEDRGNRSMTLRPEGTAPVMRAFIENQMHNIAPIQKLFYISPMFRYERSQAGRYRQHHQFGVEAIGNNSPEQDVEIIDLLHTLFKRLGLTNLQVYINSMGDLASRLAFRTALKDYLTNFFDKLSPDSQKRFESNPLRILDSKDPQDKEIVANAPSILDFLTEESRTHFEAVKKSLEALNIPYQVNPLLVRGLDYYNGTVFEIVAGELGAQNSVAGGGRYDGLMKTLGGPDLPSIGFGVGIERIIQTMLKQKVALPSLPSPTILLIPLGEAAKTICFTILQNLRQSGITSEMDFSQKKLNKVMQYANQINAKFVAIVGDEELKNQEIELKEMATGEVTKVSLLHLAKILELEIKEQSFLELYNEMTKPYETPDQAQFFVERLTHTIELTRKLSETLQVSMKNIAELLNQNTDQQ